MDIKIVDPQGEEVKQETRPEPEPKDQLVTGELLLQQIATLFDLKMNDVSHYKPKLLTLIDYAKSKTTDHTPEGLKWAIRELSFRVGTPPLGEKMIDYLTLYAHLKTDHARLEKQISKIENPTASET